jgi:hypothetical protein
MCIIMVVVRTGSKNGNSKYTEMTFASVGIAVPIFTEKIT